jgi:hypothetical protein
MPNINMSQRQRRGTGARNPRCERCGDVVVVDDPQGHTATGLKRRRTDKRGHASSLVQPGNAFEKISTAPGSESAHAQEHITAKVPVNVPLGGSTHASPACEGNPRIFSLKATGTGLSPPASAGGAGSAGPRKPSRNRDTAHAGLVVAHSCHTTKLFTNLSDHKNATIATVKMQLRRMKTVKMQL